MKAIKLILLQILAFSGLILGKFIAPEPPLYPTMPSEEHYELIKYVEIHIVMVTGFLVALISVFSSKFLKLDSLFALVATIISGLLFGSIDSIRLAEFPSFNLFLVISYLFGLASFYGLMKIAESFVFIYERKKAL